MTSRPPRDHSAGAVRLFTLAPGISCAFTGRGGGLSRPPYESLNLSVATGDSPAAVARNHAVVAAACGLPVSRLVWMRQVHGTTVARVTELPPPEPGPGPAAKPAGAEPAAGLADPGPAADTPLAASAASAASAGPVTGSVPVRDAHFTSLPGVALGAMAADCPTVLLADPVARIVGAAHSGREGTAAGVVPVLIRAMAGAGADPGRMHAAIGPAICGGCYEVPAPMRDSVAARAPGSGCVTRAGTPGLDLRTGIAAQLAAAGVRQVRTDERCTAETPDLYSYRRDGRTGRFAGLIWLTP